MIKFKIASAEGGHIIGLGITAENVKRLKRGQPIYVDMGPLGYSGLKVLVFFGQDEGALYDAVRPMIGPNTKVNPGES